MNSIVKNNKFNKELFPYVIAEIGVNHGGSISLAKKQIDLAVEGGASAVKFQTYKAEKLASKDSPPYWDIKKESSKSQYLLFKKIFNEYSIYIRLNKEYQMSKIIKICRFIKD